jgi:hypothetical protein
LHYLVRFRTEKLADVEYVAGQEWVYFSPEGDLGWAIREAEDEESLRQDLEGQEVEEVQPMLPGREYLAVRNARRELEDLKPRFVDDPSGALAEARRSVGRVLEAQGYPPPERANEASRSRQEVIREYQDTNTSDSGTLEDKRNSFNRLSTLLDHLTRT